MTADGQSPTSPSRTGASLTRIRLSTGNREEPITGLKQPFFLTRAAADDHAAHHRAPDPAITRWWDRLTKSLATFTELATGCDAPVERDRGRRATSCSSAATR
jgi:hypothetical protein